MSKAGGKHSYPVIDLFAGPGGLGEGFSSVEDENGRPRFRSVASIERDKFSHQTLLLRHFLRCFVDSEIPEDYYRYLQGTISLEELYQLHQPQFAEAQSSALQISLGPDTHDYVRAVIQQRLGSRKKWVLVGGPPCQAYSLVGRSRMMGNPDFERDERHWHCQKKIACLPIYRFLLSLNDRA